MHRMLHPHEMPPVRQLRIAAQFSNVLHDTGSHSRTLKQSFDAFCVERGGPSFYNPIDFLSLRDSLWSRAEARVRFQLRKLHYSAKRPPLNIIFANYRDPSIITPA